MSRLTTLTNGSRPYQVEEDEVEDVMSDTSVRKHGRRLSPLWDYFKLNYESGSLQANASEKLKLKLKFY